MRNKKHSTKIPIIAGIVLFIILSVVVINAQDMKTISRVKVSNKDIVISQGDTGINNQGVDIYNSGNLSSQGTSIDNQGEFGNVNGSFNNTGNFNNQNAKFGNHGEFSNTGGSFSNQGEFNNVNGSFNNTGGSFGNQNFGGENASGNIDNFNVGFNNQYYNAETNKYKYIDVDWTTWRSNFVNRILDDSMEIHTLDMYGTGTWFYYSFYVTNEGEIKDVNVFSLYLSEEDKKRLRQLIRSYAHQPITIFPRDSKRKKAKVKAIMLLGDVELKSNASNFRDIEKVKIQY